MSSDSQALVPVSSGALAPVGGLGLEGIFIRPTNVILAQPTTRADAAVAGKLYDDLTSTNYDTLQVVPLQIFRSRALFPEGGELGLTPLCRSEDGIAPDTRVEYPQAETCGVCPKGSWDNYDFKTKKGVPTCKENWQVLCILRETGLPRRLLIGGTSLKPFRKVLEAIAQTAEAARFKGEAVNLYDFTFTVGTTKIEGARGTYFIMKFMEVKRIANLGEFGGMYIKYVQEAKARKLAAQQAASGDEVVDGVFEEGEVQI